MLIASKIRQPNRTVAMGAFDPRTEQGERNYLFVAADANDPNTAYVAEVTHQEDVDALLQCGGYYAYQGTVAAVAARPTAQAQATTAETEATTTSTQETAEETTATEGSAEEPKDEAEVLAATEAPAGGPSAEVLEQAKALLDLNWQRLKSNLNQGGIPIEVVQTALDLELAKPEPDQHAAKVAALKQAAGK